MKIKKLLLLYFFLIANFLSAAENVKPLKFIEGEKLTYSVSWFNIYGGDLILNTSTGVYRGEKCLLIKGSVISAKWFSKLYYIEDHVLAKISLEDFSPLEISVDYREGKKYRRKAVYTFDYRNKVIIESRKNRLKKIPLPEGNWTDLFSAYLKVRFTPLKPGELIKAEVTDGRKFYSIAAKAAKDTLIKTDQGKKLCRVVVPQKIKFNLIGKKQRPEEIKLFIEKKDSSIPWLVTGKIRIGTITAKLKARKTN